MHAFVHRCLVALTSLVTFLGAETFAADDFSALAQRYAADIKPLLQAKCWTCHATDKREGELDLERFASLADVRSEPAVWLKVIEMLDDGQMPPSEAPQLGNGEKTGLKQWLDAFAAAEAAATAGDPGPVVLRRLNNVEYTNTIQALTGQPLEPAREFPADSAAGEGFTNTGNALVMSPALLDKYMTAAKSVAEHAILLPDGIRFSPHTTRRDWTDDVLRRLREFYGRYTDSSGSTRVNLQGLQWDTNAGGRLPLTPYLQALVEFKADLSSGALSADEAAKRRNLNPKAMRILWDALTAPNSSALLRAIQSRFAIADAQAVAGLVDEIQAWQQALTRFQSVGHMKPWLAAVEPIVGRQLLRVKLEPSPDEHEIGIALAAGDAGQTSDSDLVIWSNPRLVAAGRADIPLRHVSAIATELEAKRGRLLREYAKILAAADAVLAKDKAPEIDALATEFDLDADVLKIWFEFLAINGSGPVKLDQLFTQQLRNGGGHDFVNGWGSAETPSIMASSGDKHVRIPGNLKPHGVVVHPSPTMNAAVAWRSPFSGRLRVEGSVTHAHPECGNGVSWAVEVQRGTSRLRLASGLAQGGRPVAFGPLEHIRIREGELVTFLVGPRDGNHACDLTDIEFRLSEELASSSAEVPSNEQPQASDRAGGVVVPRQWSLTADVAPNILAGNPHPDGYGHADTWSFYAEPIAASADSRAVVPAGSLLSRWFDAPDKKQRDELAVQVEALLAAPRPAEDSPDRTLWDQTHEPTGPLVGLLMDQLARQAQRGELRGDANAILDAGREFGRSVDGQSSLDASALASRAPSVITLRLPSELCRGRELVVSAELAPEAGEDACVQFQVATLKRNAPATPPPPLTASLPVVARTGTRAHAEFAKAAADFRQIFPAALCYMKIVPVDEVVTLALFHREDENLQRLMLDDSEIAELDRLWEELHFVSNDLLTVEDAYEQLMQFATQDSDPRLFAHLRAPIQQRAAEFRTAIAAAEPRHLAAVENFAAQAFRGPLTADEQTGLRQLYDQLRAEGLDHEASTRLLLVRVLMSPRFLYRLEQSHPGTASSPVSDWELASRLSYFLWSGPPDETLRELAASGKLHEPQQAAEQARRMLADPRVRQLSREFACHWLQLHDVRDLDEKSERHFPEFNQLKGDLQTEVELFFTDLFQNDRSVLDIFDSDATFLNERLAQHYQIDGISGDQWRRVSGVRQSGRGGVLTFGATLAKQSGASRTSPILRGNWVSEVLLGERLPRPPKDVPLLPSDESSAALTVRQLVERHTHDPRCASCHVRIDAFGFALEGYDAIGRLQSHDVAGHALDTAVTLPDGTPVAGADELRQYLVTQKRDVLVRQFRRKLLGYALGRAVQLSDQPLMAEMQQSLDTNGYRVSAAVLPIIRSRQFLHIRDQDAP